MLRSSRGSEKNTQTANKEKQNASIVFKEVIPLWISTPHSYY